MRFRKPAGTMRRTRALIFSLLLPFLLAACGPPQGPVAEHMILFIGDGMQREHEIAGSRYLYGRDDGLAWQGWTLQCDVATWDVTTYDAYGADAGGNPYSETSFDPLLGYDPARGGSAPYPVDTSGSSAYLLRAATDSAAAATAMSTGVKTDAGNIAWKRGDPAGGSLATIAELVRERRAAAVGIVTTVPFDHATPAAFVSHVTSRTDYAGIAAQMLTVARPEVLVGGGHPGWCTTYFSAAGLAAVKGGPPGWTVVERAAGVAGGPALMSAVAVLSPGAHLFGLYGGASGDFELPKPLNSPGSPGFQLEPENPSLAQAVGAALAVIVKNPNGFFLMAEQGTIDHANHANDYAGMIGGVHDLDDAVRAAEAFVDLPGDDVSWDNTLVVVTADHGNGLMRLTGAPALGIGTLPAQAGPPWTYPGGEVTWATTGHTNELVTLAARGAGADLFSTLRGARYPGTAIIDNTDIFAVLRQAAGLP
jgi:alkaline phosphatase